MTVFDKWFPLKAAVRLHQQLHARALVQLLIRPGFNSLNATKSILTYFLVALP